jgi:hypothetical protein
VNRQLRFTLGVAIASLSLTAAPADDEKNPTPPQAGAYLPSQVTTVHVPMQSWQARRAAYQELAQRLRQGDFSAGKDYDAVLTEFDTRVLGRTPIENLEILGDFYIPKEGVDPALAIVVQNLVLGWYDALRFASESGRAEIVNNEGFFKLAFSRAGSDVTSKAMTFIESNPDRVHELIAQGVSFADKFRETNNYDRHWPTAYGLERIICAIGGPCKEPTEMPKERWDGAWEEAKHRVTMYFEFAKPK